MKDLRTALAAAAEVEDVQTLKIKRLDAGVWFDAKFRGTRIPTFAETIDALRGR